MALDAAVFASPRGRRFCMSLADRLDETDTVGILYRTATNAPYRGALVSVGALASAITTVSTSAITAASDADFRDALRITVDRAMYWQPPDAEETLLADPAMTDALSRIAAAAVACPRTHWWSDPLDMTAQRLVSWNSDRGGWRTLDDTPELPLTEWRRRIRDNERRSIPTRHPDPTADTTGRWWSSPRDTDRIDTTRPALGVAALRLALVEDGFGWTRALVRTVSIVGEPRVYEIDSPADWARLVEQHPLDVSSSKRHDWFHTTGRDGSWHMPDWASVAEHYDGVHVSLTGYLSAAGTAVPVHLRSGDSASVLAGWDPDTTYWLKRNTVLIEDDATEFQCTNDEWIETN